MAYHFKNDEAVPDGVRRIAVEQIDKALDSLKPAARDTDNAIHDARVCIKKIRALLRLSRGELGKKIYTTENARFRDAGRKLSEVRDTAAVIEVIDKLTQHFSEQLSSGAFRGLRKPLLQEARESKKDKARAMAEVARTLRAARRRVKKWPVRHDDFTALAPGLKQVYREGRRSFAVACERPKVRNLHEWRKQVKHLRYQARLLRPLWPKMVGRLADELERLGDYLSDDHDLAILRDRILENSDGDDERTDLEELVALIDQRRGELQLEARLLGERVYAEQPRALIQRFQAWWDAWSAEVKIDPIAAS